MLNQRCGCHQKCRAWSWWHPVMLHKYRKNKYDNNDNNYNNTCNSNNTNNNINKINYKNTTKWMINNERYTMLIEYHNLVLS